MTLQAHRQPLGTVPANTYDAGNEPGLWSDDDHQPLPLRGIHVDTDISFPVALTRLTQHYRNERKTPIEARYVFPVPLDALITALEIRIGERTLKGVVKAKAKAEREYEDAIVKGDSGFLLSRLDDGLYQVSVGNILPGEDVHLTVHWAELLRWNGNEIRYRLPNLVGPTYGDPQRAGIAPADAPVTQAGVRHPFSVAISVIGALAGARMASPSHAMAQQYLPAPANAPDEASQPTPADRHSPAASARTVLTLQGRAVLDRAFVLQLTAEQPAPLVTWCAPDGDCTAVLATLYLPDQAQANEPPRHLTLVVDCSGSMEGVSIEQARVAALRIVDSLRPGDTLSLVRFGSDTEVLTPRPLPAGTAQETLRGLCQRLDADMGGTEMQEALTEALRVTPAGGDLMLITDGECYFSDADIERIGRGGRRLFTIGVGHATSEKVLRRLAEASGGFCELVSPAEDMATHIVSHFRRLRLPRLDVAAQWPGECLCEHRPLAVFAGDTAVFSATLRRAPADASDSMVSLRLPAQVTGEPVLQGRLEPASDDLAALLPRLVAWLQLPRDHIKAAAAMAEKYQLVTEHTSMIAVLARGQDPAEVDMPEVVDVPQMMPAGVASLYQSSLMNCCLSMESVADYDTPSYMRSAAPAPNLMQTPAFLRRALEPTAATPQEWADILAGSGQDDLLLFFVADATALLPETVKQALTEATGASADAGKADWQRAVLALLALVLDALPAAKLRKLRQLRRQLAAANAEVGDLTAEHRQVQARLAGLMAEEWSC